MAYIAQPQFFLILRKSKLFIFFFFSLLDMEFIKIPRVDNIFLSSLHGSKFIPGILCLTTSHIIFSNLTQSLEIWIEYHVILNFELFNLTPKGIPLYIRCKNFRQIVFIFTNEQHCRLFFETLNYFVHPLHIEKLSAFTYSPFIHFNDKKQFPGWNIYDAESEFSRMGLPNEFWEFSKINDRFEICDTYPRLLVFPKQAIILDILTESSNFRSKGRLPTLTYINTASGCALCRSSQPLRFIGKRSAEDEVLMQWIKNSNPRSSYMYVVDLRPVINAMAQRAMGKGYENLEFYPNVKLLWGHLPNIHVVRESFTGLFDILSRYDFQNLEHYQALTNCGWTFLVKKLLDISFQCSQALVSEKINILLHCSDGWDRTSQVSSLVQIFVEPFYRTINGFIILIEKDWVSFGHPFSKRCGHISGELRDYSPIFIQFLDCVWQIVQQYPTLFEFGEEFLKILANEVYKCRYGTFITDNFKERFCLELPVYTLSLWDFIFTRIVMLRNPLYDTSRSFSLNILPIRIDIRRLNIWCSLYCQFTYNKQYSDNITESTNNLKIRNEFCLEYIDYLRRSLKQLEAKVLEKIHLKSLHTCRDIIQILSEYDLHTISDTEFIKFKCNKNFPSLKYNHYTEFLKNCSCNISFHEDNPRFHCIICGNIFCFKCLIILHTYPFSKSDFIVCKVCEQDLIK